MTNFLYDQFRNTRSQSRDSLSKYINNLSISTLDSVRTQLGMLSLLSSQTDELSRNSEVDNYFFNLKYSGIFRKKLAINLQPTMTDKFVVCKIYSEFALISYKIGRLNDLYVRKTTYIIIIFFSF